MDENSAKRFLEETFKSGFDIDRFSHFAKELFNDFRIEKKEYTPWKEYSEHIIDYERLGGYTDPSKNVIDVLAVKLKRTKSRDLARTMQRNFVAKYLTNFDKEAALVAFYGDDPQDWRFSFVKMEYRLEKGARGLKPVKELTPVKRYSFLVGKNEPNHTCKKQLLPLIMEERKNPSLEDIEKAFSIDKVTQEFFDQYKELFLELKESLDNILEHDKKTKKEFEDRGISTTVDFSKKLLGQIVFIYFLQKKGWLGVEKDPETKTFMEWGSGPKDFLRKLFDRKDYTNFFNDILEPLFYEALATQRDDDYYNSFKCKIPFLDGGLFEPINEYKWNEARIPLKNEIFSNRDRTGILDVFDRFNFTVKEDEPLEKEVAVDPEMLGKVFENLLEVTNRKSTGAFYTPREIVHYMCQQSLINYLETNGGLPKKDIENFIENSDFMLGNERRLQISSEALAEEYRIPKTIRENHLKIDQLLKEIKIVDPAVGSGAFPVGMMNEIVKARSILTLFFNPNTQKERTNYHLKRETVENCLYGVDIDSSAIDIAKLRFWLSLVVDETNMDNVKPLPNLDHKLMCGNSLLESFEGVKLFDDKLLGKAPDTKSFEIERINKEIQTLYVEFGEIEIGKRKDAGRKRDIERQLSALKKKKIEFQSSKDQNMQQFTLGESERIKESQNKLRELRKLQKQFFNVDDRREKARLRSQIDKIEWELIEETLKEQGKESSLTELEQFKKKKAKPFFLWKLYFAEVFQRENPGFDVVIANPPYVQLQSEQGKLADLYTNTGYRTFTRTGDIYCLFYERATQILRKKGVASFITSNKWMRAAYGEKLRQYFACNTQPLILIDLGPGVFETATVDTNILIFANSTSANSFLGCTLQKKIETRLSEYIRDQSMAIAVPPDGDIWEIRSPLQQRIAKKIEKYGIPLKDWNLKINFGIKTGYNEAFVIDSTKKNELIAADPKNSKIIKPLIRGRDTAPYATQIGDNWLIDAHNGFIDDGKNVSRIKIEDYLSIKRYMEQYRDELKIRTDQGDTPYNLRCLAYYKEFSKEKIVWKRIGSIMRFSYDDTGAFCLDSTCIATGEKIKYLVGVLNSKLCLYELFRISPKTGTGDQIISVQALEPLRIPRPDPKQEKEITELVNQILSIVKDKNYFDNPDKQMKVKKLGIEIDQLVYKLYNLTEDEIKLVEDFNNKNK